MPNRSLDPVPLVDVQWESPGVSLGILAPVNSPGGSDAPWAEGRPQLTVLLSVSPVPGGELRAVVVVSGEIDVATAEPLRAAVREVAHTAHPRPGQALRVVVDLSGVTFMDSSGLHLLDRLHREGAVKGWTMRVIAPDADGPHRVLRMAADRGWTPGSGGPSDVPLWRPTRERRRSMMIPVNVTDAQRRADDHDMTYPPGAPGLVLVAQGSSAAAEAEYGPAAHGQSVDDVMRHRHRKARRVAAPLTLWRRARHTA